MMRHKIAIVNDEASLMMLLRYNLETKYSLHLYDNTYDALELLDRPVDLVFLDASNYPLSGIELFQILRRETTMPIVFLSAWAWSVREELQRKGLPAADGYINLPFAIPDLMVEIEKRLSVSMAAPKCLHPGPRARPLTR